MMLVSFEDHTAAEEYSAYCVGKEMRVLCEGDVDRSAC